MQHADAHATRAGIIACIGVVGLVEAVRARGDGRNPLAPPEVVRRPASKRVRGGGDQERAREAPSRLPLFCPRIDVVHRCIARRVQLVAGGIARGANKRLATIAMVVDSRSMEGLHR